MGYFGTDWGENEFEALNSFYIKLFFYSFTEMLHFYLNIK